MTVKELQKIIKDNNIPENCVLQSDSGWECDATEMDGVFYNEQKNVIVFTQGGGLFDDYQDKKNWKVLYNKGLSDQRITDAYNLYKDEDK